MSWAESDISVWSYERFSIDWWNLGWQHKKGMQHPFSIYLCVTVHFKGRENAGLRRLMRETAEGWMCLGSFWYTKRWWASGRNSCWIWLWGLEYLPVGRKSICRYSCEKNSWTMPGWDMDESSPWHLDLGISFYPMDQLGISWDTVLKCKMDGVQRLRMRVEELFPLAGVGVEGVPCMQFPSFWGDSPCKYQRSSSPWWMLRGGASMGGVRESVAQWIKFFLCSILIAALCI